MPSDKQKYECCVCGKFFSQKSNLLRHERTVHGSDSIGCSVCGQRFKRSDKYKNHMKTHQASDQREPLREIDENGVQELSSTFHTSNTQYGGGANNVDETEGDCITEEEAISGTLKKISLEANDSTKFDPWTFLKSREDTIKSSLRKELIK